MSLPGSRQRALDRIEHTLVAEDPGLGLRFAVFTRLTRDDAMPGTEQVPGRLQRLLRPAIMLPLLIIGSVALLAAGWLLPSRQGCAPGPKVAAHSMLPVSRAARCQPGPSTRLDQMPIR
jgi:hypothetical protein